MQRSHKTALLLIIVLHAIWFAAGMLWKHFYNGDSYEYIYLAESISKGHYYGANPVLPVIDYRMSSRTPAYPLFLLTFYTLLGKGNIAVLLFQNLLSIASCWMMLKAFQRITTARTFQWIYLLFVAFYPAQMFFATTLAPDTLLQFFLMLYFSQLLLSLNDHKPARILYMSLWLILAAMVKPVLYPFLFLHGVFAIWCSFRSRARIVLLTGMLPVVVLILYGCWNQERTGLFHISSIQSNNLLNYNAKSFLASQRGQPYADSVVSAIKANMETMSGLKPKYEYASREAATIIKSDLPAYAWFHAKESLRYFIEPGKSELDLYTGYLGYDFDPKGPSFYKGYREHGVAGAWQYLKSYPWLYLVLFVFLFNLLRIVGLCLFVFNRKWPFALRLFTLCYILYFAAVTGPVSNTRYFLPVLLVMSGAAAAGFAEFLQYRRNKKQRIA